MKLLRRLLIIVVIVAILLGGIVVLIKTPKNIGVDWKEADYKAYQQKVKAGPEAPGAFNLINIAQGKFKSSGKTELDQTFTNEEISSVLSKENNINGPIKNIKVKFNGNNEGEATFQLTKEIDKYIIRTDETLARYPFISKSLENMPVYMKVKVDKASSNSITADISNLSVGQFPLPQRAIQSIEKITVNQVNNMLNKYANLSIEELKLEEGKMHFKGTIPQNIDALK